MTKKELCRRALRDWDKLVDLTLGVKYNELLKVLKENKYKCGKSLCGTYIWAETKNAVFDLAPNNKGYSKLDNLFYTRIGLLSFNQALKIRGEVRHYIVELQNTDDLTDISFYEIETTRTLKQFETEYNKLRNRWLKNHDNLPPLITYLEIELLELGFDLVQITSDLVLDF